MFEDKNHYLDRIEKGRIVALIPARGGSKGIPGKNIIPLGGFPLIAYSIVAGRLSGLIDRVIVTTDSEEIAEISKKYGAEVPFLRPEKLAGDMSGDIEFVEHFIKFVSDSEGSIPEYIVHLRPTTPLREIRIMDAGIKMCMENAACSSLRSAHPASESPFKWFLKSDGGYFFPVSEELSNEEANKGRQQFPTVYIPDGYVDVIKSEFVIRNDILHGDNLLAFESPVCNELDTMADVDYMTYELEHKSNELFEYLKTGYC